MGRRNAESQKQDQAGAEGAARKARQPALCRESIMRTRMDIAVAVGFLVLGSVARADEPAPAEGQVAPPPAVASAPFCGHPAGCCPHCKRHPLLEWLCYRPLSRPGLCGCCRQPSCCRPPLYTWFLDYCQAGGGNAYLLRLPPKCESGCGCR